MLITRRKERSHTRGGKDPTECVGLEFEMRPLGIYLRNFLVDARLSVYEESHLLLLYTLYMFQDKVPRHPPPLSLLALLRPRRRRLTPHKHRRGPGNAAHLRRLKHIGRTQVVNRRT